MTAPALRFRVSYRSLRTGRVWHYRVAVDFADESPDELAEHGFCENAITAQRWYRDEWVDVEQPAILRRLRRKAEALRWGD